MNGVVTVCLGLALAACGSPRDPGATADDGAETIDADEKADGLSTTSTYYWVNHDLRKCSSPMCGGYFVRRVNKTTTKCADGAWRASCYVGSIDFGEQDGDGARLVRGTIAAASGPYDGVLSATEVYRELGVDDPSSSVPDEPFYRITNRGVRCVAAPCPVWHRAKLNQTYSSTFDGIELVDPGPIEENDEAAMWSSGYADGLYATGYVRYAGGSIGRTFEVAHVFLATQKRTINCSTTLCPVGKTCVEGQGCVAQSTCNTAADCPQINCITAPCPSYVCDNHACVLPPPPAKTCYRGGCSSQVCSDKQGVITTCEWRADYACYSNATCEVQANGECGWTHTAQLDACLASPPT